jgi:hypothetical protein
MNLLCPSCQKMLQVPEQYAGQQMRCPLCNSTFTVPPLPDAPSLAPSPPPPPPPATGGAEVYPLADDHNAPPPPLPPTAPPPMVSPPRAPAPPPVVGDYTKLRSIVINPRVVPWIAPIALLALFLLTFFPWIGPSSGYSPWSLGFGDGAKYAKPGGAIFIFYDLFVVLGVLLAVASLLMHLRIIPDSPALQPLQAWRAVILLGFVGTAYLLLFLSLFINLFELNGIWLNFWGWLGETVHFTAVIGLLLEMWLQLRGPTRPPPRIDIHS